MVALIKKFSIYAESLTPLTQITFFKGGETMDMLHSMNTGHEGSLTTVHANSTRDAMGRLETLASMSDLKLSVDTIRDQINSAIDVIV